MKTETPSGTGLFKALGETKSDLEKSYQRNDQLIAEIGTLEQTLLELEEELSAEKARRSPATKKILDALASTETIPPTVCDALPTILRRAIEIFQDCRERDVFLTGALTALSGCLPQFWGRYGTSLYAPNIFTFTIAPAGSGKSSLNWARALIDAIEKQTQAEYTRDLSRWKLQNDQYQEAVRSNCDPLPEKPGPPPPKRSLLLPADASEAAFLKRLASNEGRGVMVDSEADTLSQTNKKEWGLSSAVLRKAYSHEPITNLRMEEDRKVENPCLSVALTGTPGQIRRLIHSIEDGEFSRFCYYVFVPDSPLEFRDIRPRAYQTAPEELFQELSEQVCALYSALMGRANPLRFTLKPQHWDALIAACASFKRRLFIRFGFNAIATAHRTGLHVFRLTMVLAIWNAWERGFDARNGAELEATDNDFNTALSLGLLYGSHAEALMSALPSPSGGSDMTEREISFYEALPDSFQTADALEVANHQGIPTRTAERLLRTWKDGPLLRYLQKGHYSKQ